MLLLEHSAILSTFIKLPFVIQIFILSIIECLLKTGFTVFICVTFLTRVLYLFFLSITCTNHVIKIGNSSMLNYVTYELHSKQIIQDVVSDSRTITNISQPYHERKFLRKCLFFFYDSISWKLCQSMS